MEGLIVLAVLVALALPVLLVAALVSVGNLKRRVLLLEQAVQRLRAREASSDAPVPRPATAPAPAVQDIPSIQPGPAAGRMPPNAHAAGPERAADAPEAPGVPAPAAPVPPPLPPTPPRPQRPQRPARPDAFEVAVRAVKRWFTSGNVPVKVGMLVLLAGVAALLKYASDQGWLSVPIQLRLAGIAAASLAALAFAWHRRERQRSFALAVQGGAIGVLLLTVFAAFKLYGLLGPLPAFGLSVVLIAGLVVMAVLQESRTLAILGVLAGFMAPIWLSDGSGHHVALFSYYALLNLAIFAVAWVRPWRILNLLGFAFTWGIGIAWGVLQYTPEKFASTEPFLLLFFGFYLLLPLLHARRAAARRGDRIDGCLLFGTPLIAFSLQAALLEGARMPLALCALGVAALYALLARALLRRERYAVLAEGYALLAAGFATLAVPLALSAQATASVFALEGAGLVWLGLRRARRLPLWSGGGLQLAAAVAMALGAGGAVATQAVANPGFMGALLIAVAGFASAWFLRDAGRTRAATVAYAWALLWWVGNGLDEIHAFAGPLLLHHAVLVFAAVTAWLAAEVHRRRPADALALTTLGGFAAAFPLALVQAGEYGQPFAGHGAWAWPVFAVLGVRSLVCLRHGESRIAAWTQFAWWLLWPMVLSLLAWDVSRRFGLADGWRVAFIALPWLAVALLSLRRWAWLAAPLGHAFDAYRGAVQATVFIVLALWWLAALGEAGRPAPLPWLPVLNPLDLAQAAVLALGATWLWSTSAPDVLSRHRAGVLSVAGLVLLTAITLRGVHHWGGVEWDGRLFGTSLAQTSLTVVWSVLGVLGWIIGSRRGHRPLWLAGAVLMGVVLLKLVLVDRGNLGNLLGIAAFIAYGLLCTLIGYLAPAPPRSPAVDDAGPASGTAEEA